MADGSNMVGQFSLKLQKTSAGLNSGPLHANHGVVNFPIYVQLQLVRRCISHPNRLRTTISSHPDKFAFGKMGLTAHAIHDLYAPNITPDRLKKPTAPGSRFFVISGRKKRFERESSVAEPAKAVVPIAVCANPLRQRSRGSCNDTPGRPIGERFERDQ